MNVKINGKGVVHFISGLIGITAGLYYMINATNFFPTLESPGFLLWEGILLIGLYNFNKFLNPKLRGKKK